MSVREQVPEPVPEAADPRRWAGLGVLVLSVLVIALDATVLDLAVPAVAAALEPSATQLLWIIDVYSFIVAGLLITMGTIGDRIGRRRLLLLGAAGFGAASALAAFSTSPEMLIAARALQGVAGATLMPSTLALIRSSFPDARERTTAIGVWAAFAGAGMAAGPLVGGWLLEHFWWGSVFIVNVPVMALLVLSGPFLVRESRDPRPGRFDPLSVALSIVAIIALVSALKETIAHGPSALNAATAAVGAGAGWWFLRRQRRPDPVLQLELFRIPAFSVAVLTNLLAMFAIAGVLYFGSQYLQIVLGYGALAAGLLTLPGMVANIAVAVLVGPLERRLGTRAVLAGGMLAATAGALLMLATTTAHETPIAFIVGHALLAGGVGGVTTVTSDAVVSAAPAERAGAAAAISETAYELGTALGVAVLGGVVTWIYRSRVDVSELGPQAAQHALDTVGGAFAAAAELGGLPGALLAGSAGDAFVSGMHAALIGTALCCASTVVIILRALRRG